MNKLPNLFYIALASFMFMSVNAQELSSVYDYKEVNLNSVDTVPDYTSKAQKIKITGTIYQNDGVTPAEGVILYVYQTNEKGNFKMKRNDEGKLYARKILSYKRIKTNSTCSEGAW